MKGDVIPDDNHVSRYIGKSKIVNGRISGEAFRLREGEESISVNWLEFFDLHDRNAEINEIRKAFVNKERTLGAQAIFAVLNIGNVKEYVQQESDDNRRLSILHDPEEPVDMSHAGIYNAPKDDPSIGDMIAELIELDAIHPARTPTS